MSDEQNPNLPATVHQQANQLLTDIVQASRDPSVDASKITALAGLAMRMQDREAERRFRIAKHRAVQNMPTISRKGAITNRAGQVQSRYSRYEDIDKVCKPILAAENLILTFNVGHEGQLVTVQPVLSYSDGELAHEERGDHMVLAIDTTGSKNATQGAGSAASYGKRHQYKATLNIVEDGEDDDGKGAAEELSGHALQLVEAARSAAQGGTEAYRAYFQALDRQDAHFLATATAETGDTYHDQNKRAAQNYD